MFRIAAGLGVITVVIGVVLTLIFPRVMGPLPGGMRSPIIAFELAQSPAEVETMFGAAGSDERAAYVRAMDAGNSRDFLFLVVYGLFFMLFSRALVEAGGKSAAWGRRFAAVPSAMDAMENVQLFAITGSLGGDYSDALSRLAWFAWLKWFGIAFVFASWIPALWSHGMVGRFTAFCAALMASMTVVAFFTRGTAAELMAMGVAVTMLGALTLSIRNSRSA